LRVLAYGPFVAAVFKFVATVFLRILGQLARILDAW
jgi:hypothetical protein